MSSRSGKRNNRKKAKQVTGKTNTALRTVVRNGEIFAMAYPTPNSKSKNATMLRTERQKFDYSTTYRTSFLRPDMTNEKSLEVYSSTSRRNNMPIRFPNEAEPYKRYCRPTNVTQFVIKDGSNADATRFNTTYRNMFGDNNKERVGFTNQSIIASRTRWLHKRLQD